MVKCEEYAEGRAREKDFFGKKNVICPLKAGDCLYGKGLTVHYEGDPITICKSKGEVEERGLIKKVEETEPTQA